MLKTQHCGVDGEMHKVNRTQEEKLFDSLEYSLDKKRNKDEEMENGIRCILKWVIITRLLKRKTPQSVKESGDQKIQCKSTEVTPPNIYLHFHFRNEFNAFFFVQTNMRRESRRRKKNDTNYVNGTGIHRCMSERKENQSRPK